MKTVFHKTQHIFIKYTNVLTQRVISQPESSTVVMNKNINSFLTDKGRICITIMAIQIWLLSKPFLLLQCLPCPHHFSVRQGEKFRA